MSNKKYEGIYPALKILFDISTKQQKILIDDRWYTYLSPMTYLKEFCTIRIATSRRGGHDYGLAKFLKKAKLKSIILSPNSYIKRIFIDSFIYMNGSAEDPNVFYGTYDDIKERNWMRKFCGISNINIVAVNPSFMLSKSLEDKLYQNIAKTTLVTCGSGSAFYVIFVG